MSCISRALLYSHYRRKTTRVFCWGSRSASSSFCLYYNSTRYVQLGAAILKNDPCTVRHKCTNIVPQINVRRTYSIFRHPMLDSPIEVNPCTFLYKPRLGATSTTAVKSGSTAKPEFAMLSFPWMKSQCSNNSFLFMTTFTDKLLHKATFNTFKSTHVAFSRGVTTDTQRVIIINYLYLIHVVTLFLWVSVVTFLYYIIALVMYL